MAGFLGVPLFVVIPAAAGLTALGWHLARILLLYRGVVTRRSHDASLLGLVPHSQLRPAIASLVQAGLGRLGAVQIDLPSQRSRAAGRACQPGSRRAGRDAPERFLMVDPSQ